MNFISICLTENQIVYVKMSTVIICLDPLILSKR